MEKTFKFKKGHLEIEFSSEKSYVEEQIHKWKSFMQNNNDLSKNESITTSTVSYTHLDVYKRQVLISLKYIIIVNIT